MRPLRVYTDQIQYLLERATGSGAGVDRWLHRWRRGPSGRRVVPEWVSLGFNGWPPNGPNCIQCRCGRVSHDELFEPEARFTKPSVEQWEQFWAICEETDVWSWPRRLGDDMVFDGLMWDLSIKWGERRVRSNGQVAGTPEHYVEGLKRIYWQLADMTDWQGPHAW